MEFYDPKTKFVNKTGLRIDFVVDDDGICPIRGLSAGKSRRVSLSLIIKRCRERGSADWPIRVLINNRDYGMRLHPRHHILKMTRIQFRYKWRPDGSSIPIVEGVVENAFDRFFACCIKWNRRTYVEIAEADSTWGRVSSGVEVGNALRPFSGQENILHLRKGVAVSDSRRKGLIRAPSIIIRRIRRPRSLIGVASTTTRPPASVMHSSTRPPPARVIHSPTTPPPAPVIHSSIVILAVAFIIVAGLHVLLRSRGSLMW